MEKLIYLDNAATTLRKPPGVAEAVAQAILTAGNAARGAHGASMQASRTVYETRQKAGAAAGLPAPGSCGIYFQLHHGAEHLRLGLRRGVGRALCRLRYCHPPRRTLCAPSARSPRHGAAGRGAVQLLRVQLGGRGGHGHSGGKGTGTEQIGKRHPRAGMPFPSCRPCSVTTAGTRMSCVSCGISGHKSLSRHSSSASPVYRARNRS